MKKEKLTAFISFLTGIILLCTAVFVPLSVTASSSDKTLYNEDYQSSDGAQTSENERVTLNVKNETADSGFEGYDSSNKYLEVGYAGTGYIKAFSLINKSSFSSDEIEAPLTLEDVSVTGQSFRFNLAKMTRTHSAGGYGLVYSYWYKNDKSYQQLVIGRKSDNQLGVWVGHDYEGYENYYTAKDTPYVCSDRSTTKESKEIMTGYTIDITESGNQWFTCSIKFESATKVTVTLTNENSNQSYTDSFEDYTLKGWLYKNSDGTGIVNNGEAQQMSFEGGLAQEDLRKTKGIGIGIASNVESNAIAAIDDIKVTVDGETYASELAAANENAKAPEIIASFKNKYSSELAYTSESFEALYSADVSAFKIAAAKVNAAIIEYNSLSALVKAGLSSEFATLDSLKKISDKYAYSYGETYTRNFNDGASAGNWTVANKDEVLAYATSISATGQYNDASFITSNDGTLGYSPAHIRSTNKFEDMSLRLISVMDDISPESRGSYKYSSISFDTIVQSGRQGSDYIYWYKDKNNYKWFTIFTNGYWLSYSAGAVIDGYTVKTKTVEKLSYDGAALANAAGNFDNINGSPVNITVLYKDDGAYCYAGFVKDNVSYKTVQIKLDGEFEITNGTDSYSDYNALEKANTDLKGIGNSTNGGFGILASPWFGARNFIDNFKVNYNLPFTIEMENGAYLRTKMPTGLRFGADVKVNDNFTGSNIKLISGGVLYMPEDKTDGKLTYETATVANTNGAKAFNIEAAFSSETSSPSKLYAAMFGENMVNTYFERTFVARAYIKYRFDTDAEGVYRIMYADENSAARSLSDVAIACANDKLKPDVEYTDGKTALEALISAGIIAE